ncbi:MAG: alpha/beta fold hydrolase [Solirubrobacterales bacterium]|jgi:pimeloyl-ACP methyl ester carboxylesterase|nr:alpha/beta fold hydrolase [Solirubrobacterales bacterium]
MASKDEHGRRLATVEQAFRTLHERYLGAEPGFDATYQIRLGDVGKTWEVRCTADHVRVHPGATGRRPDVVIGTDAQTWLELREGRLSGIEAFSGRRLYITGELDLAVAFEGLFELPGHRPPLLRMRMVDVGDTCVSTLTIGEGPDVVLIHGLGGAKSSFLDAAAALSADFRVHALDLPGFGASGKPLRAPYNAGWFADVVLRTMDALGVRRAHIAGNSMGGRVALELGLRAPERVGGLVLLCPAVAFIKRTLHPVVRLLRPELGLLPHRFTRGMVEDHLWSLFADPDAIDPEIADVIVDEFQRIYASAGGRLGFLSAARNIYLDAPFGRNGFYPRLSRLEPPALFVWGTHDPLISTAFAGHVRRWLPDAEQIVLQGCGHVPQVERAEQTAGIMRRFFRQADALSATAHAAPMRAA